MQLAGEVVVDGNQHRRATPDILQRVRANVGDRGEGQGKGEGGEENEEVVGEGPEQ